MQFARWDKFSNRTFASSFFTTPMKSTRPHCWEIHTWESHVFEKWFCWFRLIIMIERREKSNSTTFLRYWHPSEHYSLFVIFWIRRENDDNPCLLYLEIELKIKFSSFYQIQHKIPDDRNCLPNERRSNILHEQQLSSDKDVLRHHIFLFEYLLSYRTQNGVSR